MAKPSKVVPEVLAEMKRLYAGDMGAQSIARRLGLSPVTVWRALRKAGVPTLPRGAKGTHCREKDCGKPTHGARRCPLHVKIRAARLNLDAVLEYQRRQRIESAGLCIDCGVNPKAVYGNRTYSYCRECNREKSRSSARHIAQASKS